MNKNRENVVLVNNMISLLANFEALTAVVVGLSIRQLVMTSVKIKERCFTLL